MWGSLKTCIYKCSSAFQGCDEFGNHAGGPSEEDHEQHTDYESPDAASPWDGRAGVTKRDGLPPSGRETKTELLWSSAGEETGRTVKVNGRLSCLTPAASGGKSLLCSSARDGGPSLQRALKREKGQEAATKTSWMRFFFFFFLCRSAYELDYISVDALRRVGRLRFFNLTNYFSAHHSYGFSLKELIYLWWFFLKPLCNFFIFVATKLLFLI